MKQERRNIENVWLDRELNRGPCINLVRISTTELTDVKGCPGGIDSGLLKLLSLRGRMGVKFLHRKKKRRL